MGAFNPPKGRALLAGSVCFKWEESKCVLYKSGSEAEVCGWQEQIGSLLADRKWVASTGKRKEQPVVGSWRGNYPMDSLQPELQRWAGGRHLDRYSLYIPTKFLSVRKDRSQVGNGYLGRSWASRPIREPALPSLPQTRIPTIIMHPRIPVNTIYTFNSHSPIRTCQHLIQ